jgi:hypothetical protein
MNKTANYKFNLPADSDTIDIGVLDENFKSIDTLQKKTDDAIRNLETKVNAIASSMLDGTYALLLANIENYSECANMDSYGISYSQYNNGKTNTDIMKIADGVKLPKSSQAPVFFISFADKSGDESEVYNVQALLYSNGTVYARHRYLWFIGSSGAVQNPTWSEWSMEDDYVMQLKYPFTSRI